MARDRLESFCRWWSSGTRSSGQRGSSNCGGAACRALYDERAGHTPDLRSDLGRHNTPERVRMFRARACSSPSPSPRKKAAFLERKRTSGRQLRLDKSCARSSFPTASVCHCRCANDIMTPFLFLCSVHRATTARCKVRATRGRPPRRPQDPAHMNWVQGQRVLSCLREHGA